MSNIKRRFETVEAAGWMMYNINDLLYGMIQSLATYNENAENVNERLYVTKEKINLHKKTIADIMGAKTSRTVDNNINKLIEEGLLSCFETHEGKPAYGVIINEDNPYKLLSLEWLQYLVHTRNKFCLKIYVYLLDKYEWKMKGGENFYFSIRNIREALGYGSGRNDIAESAIKNVLDSFNREGIIKTIDEYKYVTLSDGDIVKIPQKKLLFVATSEQELNKK